MLFKNLFSETSIHKDSEITVYYIQWLFTILEPSQYQYSPELSIESVIKISADTNIKKSMIKAFYRMMEFYKFSVIEADNMTVTLRPVFPLDENPHWLPPRNHNYRRLTRILKCMNLFGLQSYSKALYEGLSNFYQSVTI